MLPGLFLHEQFTFLGQTKVYFQDLNKEKIFSLLPWFGNISFGGEIFCHLDYSTAYPSSLKEHVKDHVQPGSHINTFTNVFVIDSLITQV